MRLVLCKSALYAHHKALPFATLATMDLRSILIQVFARARLVQMLIAKSVAV